MPKVQVRIKWGTILYTLLTITFSPILLTGLILDVVASVIFKAWRGTARAMYRLDGTGRNIMAKRKNAKTTRHAVGRSTDN